MPRNRVPACPRRTRGFSLSLVAVVLLALLAGCALIPISRTKTANVGPIEVTAKVSAGGKIVGHELPELPTQGITQPLIRPVKLEVQKGELKGDALLRTRVPDVLPAGIRPEMVGYLTKHEPSGTWIWVGGQYDAASRTVSIQTPHFSEWVVGATSPEEIIAAAENPHYKSFIGKEFAGLLTGDVPKLSCSKRGAKPYKASDVKPLVDVMISDMLPPQVKACMDFNKDSGKFELEVVNPHSFPVRLQLPQGVTRDERLFGDEGTLQLAWGIIADRMMGGVVILQQEGKIHLLVDPKQVTEGTIITGELDYATFLVDTSIWLTDLLVQGRQLERLNGRNDPDSKSGKAEDYARFLLDRGEDLKCLLGVGNDLYNDLRNDPRRNVKKSFTKAIGTTMSKCKGQILDGISELGNKLLDLPHELLKDGFLGRLKQGWHLLETSMAQARRELDVLLISALGGGKIYKLKVKPTRTVHIERALPEVGEPIFDAPEGGSFDEQGNRLNDNRYLSSELKFWLEGLLDPNCTHGLEISPYWVEGGKVAIAAYTVTGVKGGLRI